MRRTFCHCSWAATSITIRREHIRSSPLYYVNPLAAPTLTAHGTKDTYVNYEHALWLTGAA